MSTRNSSNEVPQPTVATPVKRSRSKPAGTFPVPPVSYWKALGISWDALEEKASPAERKRDLQDQLEGLGAGNLRYLCQELKIPRSPSADAGQLVRTILATLPREPLCLLREFLRRRSTAIQSLFESIPTLKAAATAAEISRIADNPKETLKPFTRLILLYCSDPMRLNDIYYLHVWRSRPTFAEFETDRTIPSTFPQILQDARANLVQELSDAISKRRVKMFGVRTLPDKTTIVLLDREFNPTIEHDFRKDQNVVCRAGRIVFGISHDGRRVIVKVGNARLIEAICAFIRGRAGVELTPLRNIVFADYDRGKVAAALLGGYPAEKGIEVLSADFKRTRLHTRPAIEIRHSWLSPSIRSDLKQLTESGVLRLSSLDDLNQMTMSFKGKNATIHLETVSGGAVWLRLDDAGWQDSERLEFEQAFLETFELPLNRLIDPQQFELGSVPVVSHLLTVTSRDEVEQYQQQQFELLISKGLLEVYHQNVRVCNNITCRPRKPIADATIQSCPKCDRPIVEESVELVRRSESGIVGFIRSTIDSILPTWKLGAETSFETVRWRCPGSC